jgi:hypothetical protein
MELLRMGSVDIVGSAPTNTAVPGSGKQLVSYGHVVRRSYARTAAFSGNMSLLSRFKPFFAGRIPSASLQAQGWQGSSAGLFSASL